MIKHTCCLCGIEVEDTLDCAANEVVCDDCAYFDEQDRCAALGIEGPAYNEFLDELKVERQRLGVNPELRIG